MPKNVYDDPYYWWYASGAFLIVLIIFAVLIPTVFLQPYYIYSDTVVFIPVTPYPTASGIIENTPTNLPTTASPTTPTVATPAPTLPPEATAAPTSSFNIQLTYAAAYTPVVTEAFEYAANKWKSVITAQLPISVVANGDYCGGTVSFSEPTEIQDLYIHVEINTIDGPNGVLGYAGPCAVDINDIPRIGIVFIDSADVEPMILDDTLKTVAAHEIGHVLGIGVPPTWVNGTAYLEQPGGYPYLLPHANTEDAALGRTGGAVVEDLGGSGTAGAHWKEAVYDHELMTGFAESTGTMPLSRLTVGALKDLGYQVNLDAAESYSLPSRRRLRGSAKKRHYHHCTDWLEKPVRLETKSSL